MQPIPRFETIRAKVEEMRPGMDAMLKRLATANPQRMTTKEVQRLLASTEEGVKLLHTVHLELVAWIDEIIMCALLIDPHEPLHEDQGAVAQVRQLLNHSLNDPGPVDGEMSNGERNPVPDVRPSSDVSEPRATAGRDGPAEA